MRTLYKKYKFLFSLFLATQVVTAQTTLETAQSALQSGDYADAVKAYETELEANPANARAWFGLGRAYHALEKYPQAIKAYRVSDSLGFYPQFVHYNIARSYALASEMDSALNYLDKAIQAGYANPDHLESDTDLTSFHENPALDTLVTRADKNARPCEYDSTYLQLDFWIGTWEVYNPRGQLVGHNRIEKSLNGCMLLEHWIGIQGSEGKSINYYDPRERKWRQQWVGSTGYIINYTGEFKKGAMHLQGENISKDGSIQLSRMTLTPKDDGTVRQLIEQSPDAGKTWNIWFDGLYKPTNTAMDK